MPLACTLPWSCFGINGVARLQDVASMSCRLVLSTQRLEFSKYDLIIHQGYGFAPVL